MPATAKIRNIGVLAGLTVVLLYSTVHRGGVAREDRDLYLLALGVLTLLAEVSLPRARSSRFPALFRWLLPLLLAWVVFQMIPLPSALIGVLSPARAEALRALDPKGALPQFATLSVYPSGTLQRFLLVCGYVAVFALVWDCMAHSSRRVWLIVAPLVVVAAWQAVFGILQYSSLDGGSAHGNFANRDHFAGLLELVLPFTVVYPAVIYRARLHRGEIRAMDALAMGVSWALAVLLFVGIMLSLSRLGFLSTIFSLMVTGALIAMKTPAARYIRTPVVRWIAAGSLVAITLGLLVYLPPARLVERFAHLSEDEGIDKGRTELWRDTMKLIWAYPIVGCGLGGYESAFPKYKVSGPMFTDDYAHNDYLQFLAELGVVGGIILFALGSATLRAAFRTALRAPDPQTWGLAVSCAGSLSAILFHSTGDFNLSIPANTMIVAWVGAIAIACHTRLSYVSN